MYLVDQYDPYNPQNSEGLSWYQAIKKLHRPWWIVVFKRGDKFVLELETSERFNYFGVGNDEFDSYESAIEYVIQSLKYYDTTPSLPLTYPSYQLSLF